MTHAHEGDLVHQRRRTHEFVHVTHGRFLEEIYIYNLLLGQPSIFGR
jgi:hypothetical protein